MVTCMCAGCQDGWRLPFVHIQRPAVPCRALKRKNAPRNLMIVAVWLCLNLHVMQKHNAHHVHASAMHGTPHMLKNDIRMMVAHNACECMECMFG